MYRSSYHLTVAHKRGWSYGFKPVTKRYPYRVIWSHRMTTNELNNVSKACKLIGYSRQQFYEIRRNYQVYGAEGDSVRAVCVACGNVTTCSPNTTVCCASRKLTESRPLSSMTSKFACSIVSAPSSANAR